jgi:hypothetical protein
MDADERSVTSDAEPGNLHEPAAGNGVRWRRGLDPRDEERLNQAREDHSAIVEEIPVAKASLGAFSVACLLFNRMIGSGIFNSSSVVFYNTQSIGASLLMWLYGVVMALSGLVLYIELGLTIPRWQLRDGTKISTPRSGAELVYVSNIIVSSVRAQLIPRIVQLLSQGPQIPGNLPVWGLLPGVWKHGDKLGRFRSGGAGSGQHNLDRAQDRGPCYCRQHVLLPFA